MEGVCLCGAIKVSAETQNEMGVCHCSMCRRWSGGPMFAVHCGANVSFTGAEPKRYVSSEWANRGFCPECGTHLFYHLLPSNEYILPAGLFQDESFAMTNEIFIDEKPDDYAFKNETKKLTGKEVFEQFT